jgi:3-oxoacyl-[acyl-carrier-protein] synthase II
MKKTLANSGERIVVTGMGAITPLGLDVESTWSSVLEGKSGAGTITHFDSSKIDVHFACEVKNFDPTVYIPKKEQKRMDRFIQLGVAASLQAIAQSELDSKPVAPDRVGVYLASGIGGLPMIEATSAVAADRPDRVSPFFIPAVISNLLAGQISILKGYQGPSHCIVSACSSSAHAIGEACRTIERGDADVVIAGGAEASISLLGIAGFASMKALSKRNDDPQTGSRPFDQNRDGFVMGEGSAVLVLESLKSAERRGAKVLGEIAGYGANSDAYHMTSPSENGEGAARCMRLALEDSAIPMDAIGHVNMHGTSTPLGDIAESKAILSVFGSRAQEIQACSTKSMMGHLLGAAGAVEAMITVLAVERGICPPTINIVNQDPLCPLNYTPNRPVLRPLRAALSNSFGFGGTNVSLVVKKL